MTDIKPQDIEALLETFDNSPWQEMRLKVEGLELFLSKTPGAIARSAAGHHSTDPTQFPTAHATAPAAPQHAISGARAKSTAAHVPDHWIAVRAPNLGDVLSVPKARRCALCYGRPDGRADTEVCLIEVMKLFTSVLAGVGGAVRRVLVEDGELVEYDQPLFLIEPA